MHPIKSRQQEVEHVLSHRLLDPARAAGIDLEAIGVGPPPTGETLVQEPSGRWWMFNDHRDDPLAHMHGGTVVPRDVRERLERLLANGFSADVILVGHELPDDWNPGQPIPGLGAAPSYTTRAALGQDRHGVAGDQAAARAVASTLSSLMAAGAALGTFLARFAGALAELDPVVVAGARIPNSDHLVYVEVARWSW